MVSMPAKLMALFRVVALLGLVLFPVHWASAQSASPVGVWRTFDDEDGSETGAIEIVGQDGVLSGRLIRILNPAHAGDICTGCRDDRRGQAMLGLQLIRKVRPQGIAGAAKSSIPKAGGSTASSCGWVRAVANYTCAGSSA